MTTRIAVALTCHNRKPLTLACLEAVTQQAFDAQLDIYLVDDGSTDATGDAVRAAHPGATVIDGDGSLFWNHGMRLALTRAYAGDYDYYLWMNDDTVLDEGALSTLLETSIDRERATRRPVIVVGATRDAQTGELTYGGLRRLSPLRRARFSQVAPGPEPIEVETSQGNVLLVSREVARRVGNLHPGYRHSWGDEDFGLSARREGCGVWMAPGFLATCSRNPIITYGRSTLREELRALFGLKGLPPRCWAEFTRRWAGPFWPVYWLSPYVRQIARMLLARVGIHRTSLRAPLNPVGDSGSSKRR